MQLLRIRWQASLSLTWCPLDDSQATTGSSSPRGRIVDLLDAIVQTAVGGANGIPISWHPDEGQLRIASLVIRNVAPNASLIRPLFDHFEINGWEPLVSRPPDHRKGDQRRADGDGNPLPWADPTLNEALRSIRTCSQLQYIEFFGQDGKVGWRWNLAGTISEGSP